MTMIVMTAAAYFITAIMIWYLFGSYIHLICVMIVIVKNIYGFSITITEILTEIYNSITYVGSLKIFCSSIIAFVLIGLIHSYLQSIRKDLYF